VRMGHEVLSVLSKMERYEAEQNADMELRARPTAITSQSAPSRESVDAPVHEETPVTGTVTFVCECFKALDVLHIELDVVRE
jgi:hypothetical protein